MVGEGCAYLCAVALHAGVIGASDFDARGGLTRGGESGAEGRARMGVGVEDLLVVAGLAHVGGGYDRGHDAVYEDVAGCKTAVLISLEGEARGEIERPVSLVGWWAWRVHDGRL